LALVLLLELGVNPEMDAPAAKSSQEQAHEGTIVLDSSQVQTMRRLIHELANVLTGVMISGGLLSQYLEGNALRSYASGVCEGCERGGVLVRELRSQLLAAFGEPETAAGRLLQGAPEGQKPGTGSF
jgi:nitrogen-specific signal transduction histidine kinase